MSVDVGYCIQFDLRSNSGKSIKSTTNTVEHKCTNPLCGKVSRTNYCPECGSKIEQTVTVKSKKFESYYGIFLDRYMQVTGKQFGEDSDIKILMSDDSFIIPLTYGCESHCVNEGDYYSEDHEIFVSLDIVDKNFLIGLMSKTLQNIISNLPEDMNWKFKIYAKEE